MILSRAVRRKIRRLREAAFLLRHRLRRRDEPVLLFRPASGDREEPLRHPAIRIVLPEDGEGVTAALEKQSETSWTCSGTTETPWIFYPGPGLSGAAPAMLEGLLLSGVCCGLDVVRTDPACGTLLRTPGPKPGSGLGYGGKTPGGVLKSFRGWLSAEAEVREIRIELHDPEQVLGGLPGLPGQRTAVIVLPFLAVGGAEQLLFDLLRSWAGKYRVLLVTLDEHRKELGSNIGRFAGLGLPLYPLGDRLPRDARLPALRHLIRRWRAESLFSWNGSIDYYDHVEEIGRDFPALRIFDQHYNHEGAWLDWLSAGVIRCTTAHVAVNDAIADALHDRGARRVETIHHAVTLPALPPEEERRRLRRERRLELGLPQEAVLVGSFIRLHPQKRPRDILRLAWRMSNRPFHFLLVGGGPLEAEIEEELRRHPLSNFTRLPMQQDTTALFDALDICLLTSAFEGLPVFLLEGLAREIPCVSTDVGEVRTLLSRGGGVLGGEPGDLDAIEAALEQLRDPARRRREGIRGREKVARDHGLDAYARAYERLVFP